MEFTESKLSLCQQLFSHEQDAGGRRRVVHFNDVSRYTKWGRWGALEYVAQPRPDSPKFDAIQTFIEQNPVWWSQ